MIQFSLVSMLELVDNKVMSIERLVELMCHNPARLFDVRGRGFLRKGFKADVVVVRPGSPWTVTKDVIQSKWRHGALWRDIRSIGAWFTRSATACMSTTTDVSSTLAVVRR